MRKASQVEPEAVIHSSGRCVAVSSETGSSLQQHQVPPWDKEQGLGLKFAIPTELEAVPGLRSLGRTGSFNIPRLWGLVCRSAVAGWGVLCARPHPCPFFQVVAAVSGFGETIKGPGLVMVLQAKAAPA